MKDQLLTETELITCQTFNDSNKFFLLQNQDFIFQSQSPSQNSEGRLCSSLNFTSHALKSNKFLAWHYYWSLVFSLHFHSLFTANYSALFDWRVWLATGWTGSPITGSGSAAASWLAGGGASPGSVRLRPVTTGKYSPGDTHFDITLSWASNTKSEQTKAQILKLVFCDSHQLTPTIIEMDLTRYLNERISTHYCHGRTRVIA